MRYRFLLLFLPGFLLQHPAVSAQEQYILKVSTGNKIEYETLVLQSTGAGFSLSAPATTNWLDINLNQLAWERVEDVPGNHFKAERYGNLIILEGTFKKLKVKREYKIDARPWYQYPEIMLKEFALSGRQRTEFWIISPDNLAILEFEAIKIGEETITIQNQRLKTIRVRIQPLGLAGSFWHADYWFQLPHGSYVRYEAVHGGPGTPPTIKELAAFR